MASHFKEPEEKPRRGRDAAAGAHTPVSTPAHRGGDESYHAPVGNPHAAANAGRVHAALAGSRLALVPGAGHGPNHPGMVRMAHRALAAFAADGNFGGWTGAGGATVA